MKPFIGAMIALSLVATAAHAAPQPTAKPAAKSRARSKKSTAQWLPRATDIDRMTRKEFYQFISALRSGLTEPLLEKPARSSASILPQPAGLRWDLLLQSAAEADELHFICSRGGFFYSKPELCADGQKSLPQTLKWPESIRVGGLEPMKAAARTTCPDDTQRLCDPLKGFVSVYADPQTNQSTFGPICVPMPDPGFDKHCAQIAEGRWTYPLPKGADGRLRWERPADEEKRRGLNALLSKEFIALNYEAFNKEMANIELACSPKSLAYAADHAPPRANEDELTMAERCAVLRSSVGRLDQSSSNEALDGICRTNGPKLRGDLQCYACAIEANERRSNRKDPSCDVEHGADPKNCRAYQTNRLWLGLLNLQPRLCDLSRAAVYSQQSIDNALRRLGYCREAEKDALNLTDVSAGDIESLNSALGGTLGSDNLQFFENIYGFKVDEIKEVICAEGRQNTVDKLRDLEKSLKNRNDSRAGADKLRARAQRFLSCAKEAVNLGGNQARGLEQGCCVQNRVGGQILGGPLNYFPTVATADPRSRLLSQSCSVVLAKTVDGGREKQKTTWLGLEPANYSGVVEVLDDQKHGTEFNLFQCSSACTDGSAARGSGGAGVAQ